MPTQSIYKELYAGITLKEVRIFIIEKCREYYQAGLGFPQNAIIIDDCFLKFYNGQEPKGEHFSEWLFKYKYNEVKEYYKQEIISKQLTLLF